MQQPACFTGHRSISGNILSLKRRLYKAIERDIAHHEITDFYTGGAIGWDTLAAQVILKIRESHPHTLYTYRDKYLLPEITLRINTKAIMA